MDGALKPAPTVFVRSTVTLARQINLLCVHVYKKLYGSYFYA